MDDILLVNNIIKDKYKKYIDNSKKYFRFEKIKTNLLSKLDYAKKLKINTEPLKEKLDSIISKQINLHFLPNDICFKYRINDSKYIESFINHFPYVNNKVIDSCFGKSRGVMVNDSGFILYHDLVIKFINLDNIEVYKLKDLNLISKEYDDKIILYFFDEKYNIELNNRVDVYEIKRIFLNIKENKKHNQYYELLANQDFEFINKICKKELIKDDLNPLAWYMMFLVSNKDYRIEDIEFGNEIAFNKAKDLADTNLLAYIDKDYQFYSTIINFPELRDIYRDLDYSLYSIALEKINKINRKYSNLPKETLDMKSKDYEGFLSGYVLELLKEKL